MCPWTLKGCAAQVVCCPGGVVTGYTNFLPNEEQLESQVVNRAYMEAKMVVALAGRQAPPLPLPPRPLPNFPPKAT